MFSIAAVAVVASANHHADRQHSVSRHVTTYHDPSNICERDPEFCAENSVSEPIRSCTEGFAYDEAAGCCVSDVVYDPLMHCLNGGVPLEDGTCDVVSYPRLTCPEGYAYDTGRLECVLSERTPMIPTCANMPELGGTLTADGRQCEYYKVMESRPKCSNGAKFRDGRCVVIENMKSVEDFNFVCPDGWALDFATRECAIVEQVDCNESARKVHKGRPCRFHDTEEHCPFEEFRACEGDCVMPDSNSRRLCSHGDCKEVVKPEHVCQASVCKMKLKERARDLIPSSFVQPVACERVTTLPAKVVCPDGGVYNKKTDSCCVESFLEPEQVCTGGAMPDEFGNCPKLMHYTADYVCPEPFQVVCDTKVAQRRFDKRNIAHPSNCECLSVATATAAPVCGEGTVLDEVSNMCLSNVPAEPYCPEVDATLTADGVCIRTEHEPVRIEYNVLYVTEKACELDTCVRERIPIKKRTVTNREVTWKKGRPHTRCNHTRCTNINGDVVVEPVDDVEVDDDFVAPPIPTFTE